MYNNFPKSISELIVEFVGDMRVQLPPLITYPFMKICDKHINILIKYINFNTYSDKTIINLINDINQIKFIQYKENMTEIINIDNITGHMCEYINTQSRSRHSCITEQVINNIDKNNKYYEMNNFIKSFIYDMYFQILNYNKRLEKNNSGGKIILRTSRHNFFKF